MKYGSYFSCRISLKFSIHSRYENKILPSPGLVSFKVLKIIFQNKKWRLLNFKAPPSRITKNESRTTNHDSHQLALTISASLTEINPVSPDDHTDPAYPWPDEQRFSFRNLPGSSHRTDG